MALALAAAAADAPGALLPHMRLPPAAAETMEVAGPCRWSGPPLNSPPDGYCFLYAWLASLEPERWQAVAKDSMGFIVDAEEEGIWKAKARSLLDKVLALMESEGAHDMAGSLRRGAYPGDEEFAFYTRALGGAFLLTPLSEDKAFPVIHGEGPVHCELGFVYSTDGAGYSSGHYVLLRSWAPDQKIAQPAARMSLSDSDSDSNAKLHCPPERAGAPPLADDAASETDDDAACHTDEGDKYVSEHPSSKLDDNADNAQDGEASRCADAEGGSTAKLQTTVAAACCDSQLKETPNSDARSGSGLLDGAGDARDGEASRCADAEGGSPAKHQTAVAAASGAAPSSCDSHLEETSPTPTDKRGKQLQTSTWATAAMAFGRTSRILKIRPKWLGRILSGEKTIEIRGEGLHENHEALREISYPAPWAWPLEEVEVLPAPISIPSWVAKGSVRWITRERWEAFDRDPGLEAAPFTPTAWAARQSKRRSAEQGCEDAAPQKKPKQTMARKRYAAELCSTQSCIFNPQRPGSAARRPRLASACAFCSKATMQTAAGTPAGRGRLTKALKAFRTCSNGTVHERALKRLRHWAPAHAARIEKSASAPKRHKPVEGGQCASDSATWESCKARRRHVAAPPDGPAKKVYRSAVLADQRYAKKRFYPDAPRRARASGSELLAPVDNDCDLPPASRSDVSIGLQRWCTEGAWGMCTSCQMLQMRPLRPRDLQAEEHKPEVPRSSCRRCGAKHPHVVPRPEDVPLPLRELPHDVVQALRPLTIDVGPVTRADNGYRKKVRMTTFSWGLEKVDVKVEKLPKESRRLARAALKFLRRSSDSLYGHFYDRHCSFLDQNASGPTPEVARRPLQFIEEPGLENALWPHLYWDANMCESYERLNRRRFRQLAATEDPQGQAETSDADEAEDVDDRRHSIKRSFLCKLLSPLLGYGSDFELLQFVYDLHLWTDLGSKRNVADGTAMRIMMRGHPMSPLYWKDVKNGLHDLVRQIGYPHLYWTLAPYERSFPYHAYLLDEMQKLLRERMRLPAFECLHLTHTMLQVTRSLLAGRGRHRGTGWTRHLLGKGQGLDGVHFFTRIEFQDGSKKAGTQQYHGSGRPHVHALFWLRDPAAVDLGSIAAATENLPEAENDLAAFVRGSQRDDAGESRWPVHDGPPQFDPVTGGWTLPHTPDDADQGVRGYFLDIMDALRCHQDLQCRQGRGLLLAYVAKYVAKWSDSSYDEWMSDASSVTSLCRKILFEYHPLEPEMVLQLTQGLRQWEFGTVQTGRRSVRAPHPWDESAQQPLFVQKYMDCAWRGETMSLLEYLRKSGPHGEIAAWLRQRHEEAQNAGTQVDLEEFVRGYMMRGEQVVAVDYLWRLNDRFFGQWCMMHLPFRSLEIFRTVRGVDSVPDRYRGFATALLLTDNADGPHRGHWRDLGNLVRDMQLEGHTDAIIRDTRLFLEAVTVAVNAYIDGRIDKTEEDSVGKPVEQARLGLFEGQQLLFFNAIQERVTRSLQAQQATDDTDVERIFSQLRDLQNRPLICSGRPGTGKTTVALECAQCALADGAAVLVTCPTARMAGRVRQRLGDHANLVVDTAAAAFQFHLPEQEAAYVLCGYTLVIVDEYSQLGLEDFERVLRLWSMADRVPAMVFLGDKYQLPGVAPQRPWESTAWKSCQRMELAKIYRSHDPAFLQTLALLRSSMPTKTEVNKICRGHKAWSGKEPTLLHEYPTATYVAATRSGVALINKLALAALYPGVSPAAVLPGAYEDNPENFNNSSLRLDRQPAPTDVEIYLGARIYLTRNVRKTDDFVNGMGCTVLEYEAATRVLWVRTDTGKRLPVTPWHDPEFAGLVYYPLRLGYCSTIAKVQGDEFSFIIIYLDVPNLPAVGYTALSRVKDAQSYLLGGVLTPEHFTPVTLR
ncbi:PIF1 [Symbiodinium natans]|uniref:PIF1 protein n=1 Tax=Symbiodinium natans TaxID=878477 RepID=A0A812PDL5_9DINO|nr:PIF1 [Symbiodinium natans]